MMKILQTVTVMLNEMCRGINNLTAPVFFIHTVGSTYTIVSIVTMKFQQIANLIPIITSAMDCDIACFLIVDVYRISRMTDEVAVISKTFKGFAPIKKE